MNRRRTLSLVALGLACGWAGLRGQVAGPPTAPVAAVVGAGPRVLAPRTEAPRATAPAERAVALAATTAGTAAAEAAAPDGPPRRRDELGTADARADAARARRKEELLAGLLELADAAEARGEHDRASGLRARRDALLR